MRVTKLRQKDSAGVFGEAIPIGTDAQYITVESGDTQTTLDKVLVDIDITTNDLYESIINLETTVDGLTTSIDALADSTSAQFEEIHEQLESITASVVWESIKED